MVNSILNYISCVWGVASQQNLNAAERVIQVLARLVLHKRKFDPASLDTKLDLNWLFPKDMSIFRTFFIISKIVKLNNVLFFDGYFCKLSEVHNHVKMGRARIILIVPQSPGQNLVESYVMFKNKLRNYLPMQ